MSTTAFWLAQMEKETRGNERMRIKTIIEKYAGSEPHGNIPGEFVEEMMKEIDAPEGGASAADVQGDSEKLENLAEKFIRQTAKGKWADPFDAIHRAQKIVRELDAPSNLCPGCVACGPPIMVKAEDGCGDGGGVLKETT